MPSWRIENSRWESCDLTTGEWWGADDGDYNGMTDSNGIGFSKGGGSSDDDAAIWFDIKVKDQSGGIGDGDGLSHRAERFHGTDPEIRDSDGDGLNDRWEVVYGLDPDDGTTDLTDESDNDGIELIDEYTYGGIPGQKDIFVEVDWMKGWYPSEPNGHPFKNEAIGKVIRAFAREDIGLHIDDGREPASKVKYMGGGGSLITENYYWMTFDDTDPAHTDYPDFYDFKGTSAGPTQLFDWNRKGIFHYSIFAHKIWWQDPDDNQWKDTLDGIGERISGGHDDFMVADANMNPKIDDQAQTFMHELGHNLGLLHPDEDPDIPDNVDSAMQSGVTTVDYDWREWDKISLPLPINGD